MIVGNSNITHERVEQAVENWCRSLVGISQTYNNHGWGKARVATVALLTVQYNFNNGPVLFKPTLAQGDKTFRNTFQGALSYFVGGNPEYPDEGFALQGWETVEPETNSIYIEGNTAMWMGKVVLVDEGNAVLKVDKSFGFRDSGGLLKIVLHHSSLHNRED